MDTFSCQIQNANTMQEDRPKMVPISLRRRLRLIFARSLDPRIKHSIKLFLKRLNKWRVGVNPQKGASLLAVTDPGNEILLSGDKVRIRSIDEILKTLDSHRRLKGCSFMPEMQPYCGTVQRVYKPLERFLNENDYTIRTSKGLVLLENLYCQGVAEAGRCDRSCFFFWRVEWLEKLEGYPC